MNDPQLETDEFARYSMMQFPHKLVISACDISGRTATRSVCQFALMDADTIGERDRLIEAVRDDIRRELRSYNDE